VAVSEEPRDARSEEQDPPPWERWAIAAILLVLVVGGAFCLVPVGQSIQKHMSGAPIGRESDQAIPAGDHR
jgi:hypothetical protein